SRANRHPAWSGPSSSPPMSTGGIMLKTLTTILTAASMLTAAGAAMAQDNYPSKTVSILVPAAPGGGTDFMARLIADKLGEALGATFMVENREGANGNLAMREV